MTKDKRLGRGLAALLGTPIEGDDQSTASTTMPSRDIPSPTHTSRANSRTAETSLTSNRGKNTISTQSDSSELASCYLDVTLIAANPFQPRREFNTEELESLAASIKSHQQLQPILVRRKGEKYELISGERRLRATILAGLTTIRAEIREADDRLVSELAIIENLQRKDLNAIEKAMSFKRYIHEHQCTQEELANRLKIDRSTVTNFMRLLELPDSILEDIQKDRISASHAKAVLSLSSEEEQLDFARRIQAEGWSVRETEKRVAERVASEELEDRDLAQQPTRAKSARAKSEHVAMLETSMKRQLGTKVEIVQTSKGRGRIVIHFANRDEFERLRSVLDDSPSSRLKVA